MLGDSFSHHHRRNRASWNAWKTTLIAVILTTNPPGHLGASMIVITGLTTTQGAMINMDRIAIGIIDEKNLVLVTRVVIGDSIMVTPMLMA
jgi:hypothetical protein